MKPYRVSLLLENTLLLDREISRLQYLFVLAAKAFIDSIHYIKGIDPLIIGLLINKSFIKALLPSLQENKGIH